MLARARMGLLVALVTAVLAPRASPVLASPERADQLVAAALKLHGSVQRGEKGYLEHCARCHYETAAGDPENLVPKLAGQRKGYIVKQLADFLEIERDGDEMHTVVLQPFVDEPQTWADIATYLSSIPVMPNAEIGDGASLQLGAAMYQKQCASCHGADARGREDGYVPSLRNQHYSYLVWQMRSVAAARRLHVHPDVVRLLDSLSANEVAAIADYLSRFQTSSHGSAGGDATMPK